MYDLYDDKNIQITDVVNQIICHIIRFHRIISDFLREKLILRYLELIMKFKGD